MVATASRQLDDKTTLMIVRGEKTTFTIKVPTDEVEFVASLNLQVRKTHKTSHVFVLLETSASSLGRLLLDRRNEKHGFSHFVNGDPFDFSERNLISRTSNRLQKRPPGAKQGRLYSFRHKGETHSFETKEEMLEAKAKARRNQPIEKAVRRRQKLSTAAYKDRPEFSAWIVLRSTYINELSNAIYGVRPPRPYEDEDLIVKASIAFDRFRKGFPADFLVCFMEWMDRRAQAEELVSDLTSRKTLVILRSCVFESVFDQIGQDLFQDYTISALSTKPTPRRVFQAETE